MEITFSYLTDVTEVCLQTGEEHKVAVEDRFIVPDAHLILETLTVDLCYAPMYQMYYVSVSDRNPNIFKWSSVKWYYEKNVAEAAQAACQEALSIAGGDLK